MPFLNIEFMVFVIMGFLGCILWELDSMRNDISEFIQHMYEWEDEFENEEDKK